MDKTELLELEDLAVDLALAVFDDPTEDHIAAIQERLVWNAQRGLGADGATTVH